MKVFVDTSALMAALDAEDPHHAEAQADLRDLLAIHELITHNYIHLEADALVRRRLGRNAAVDLHERLLPALATIWVGEATHRRALAALRAADRRGSLVDYVSFEVMADAGITNALAYDRDFEARGFGRPPTTNRTGPRQLSEQTGTYGSAEAPSDLVSVKEVAARSGRSVNTVQSWRRRRNDFPSPVVELAAGPVWSWRAVDAWIRTRPPRRQAA